MDELAFPRPGDLADEEWAALSAELEAYADLRYRQTVEARTYAPHVVAHDVTEERDAVTECPDCTRGLVADGTLLVCYDLRRNRVPYADLTGTFHDIIACGRPVP